MLPEWDDRKVEKRMNINREEILALTRRMTVKRTSMTRIAGCYADAEGFIDGTFNVNFLKLSPAEREKNLELAKTVPFAQTNQNLKRYVFPESEQGGMRQLLMGIWDCGLKNDALLDVFYEKVTEVYQTEQEYAVYLFHDRYDIPAKAKDKERLGESEQKIRIRNYCRYYFLKNLEKRSFFSIIKRKGKRIERFERRKR